MTHYIDDILISCRHASNIDDSDDSFDVDLIPKINAELFEMNQIGIGETGYSIDKDNPGSWAEFVGYDDNLAGTVSALVGMRCRLMFDPPANSVLRDTIQRDIDRLEWRVNIEADYNRV